MGYRSQAVQPVFVVDVDPIHAELIKVQREVFTTILEDMKPGISVKELAEKTAAAAAGATPNSGPAAGATAKLTMHGRGAGDDGPIITNHARDPEHLATQLQESMVFIFKPASVNAEGTHTCTWGDTIVIGPNGGRRLGKRPHDLAVSGA